VRGAAGTGIKEPTFFENYATGFATGNPDLDPERSTSWELGVEQSVFEGALQLSGAWFDQEFQDLIQYTFSPPNPGDPNYFNIAEARARGVEAGVLVSSGNLNASGDVTWLDTEVIDSGFDSGEGATFVEGERLLRRPHLVLGGSAGYRVDGRGVLRASLRRVGEREDRDFSAFPATPVTLDAYTLVGVGGEVTVLDGVDGPALAVTLRADNLLDAEYQEVFGFAAPGRQFYLGVRVGLGGR
jgi:vitamin B12 transporter